jgi:hypothetical protein
MKKTFGLSMALLFLATAASAQNWFKGSFEDALSAAKNEKKLVLVNFYSGG